MDYESRLLSQPTPILGLQCVIIGIGTLPVACANILLNAGANIAAIISTDDSVISWSKNNNIPYARSVDALSGLVCDKRIDIVFSIVNPWILADEILNLGRIAAINYHDSPLPQYGGTHATSWALMAEEVKYAVTWHKMTNQVDQGDILWQESVSITNRDTAFSLNLKCHEAALRAFEYLLKGLEKGSILPRSQCSTNRSFFHKYKRPYGAGVLSFSESGRSLDALVRSLDFGEYYNPLALPKIIIKDEVFYVGNLECLDWISAKEPSGKILHHDHISITIATKTCAVRLRNLYNNHNEPASIDTILSGNHIGPDHTLCTTPKEMEALSLLYNEHAAHESFWIDYLRKNFNPTPPPFCRELSNKKSYRLTTSHDVGQNPSTDDGAFSIEKIITALGVYLAKVNDDDVVSIGFIPTLLTTSAGNLSSLFASVLPLQLCINSDSSVEAQTNEIGKIYQGILQKKTYPKDLLLRHPELRTKLTLLTPEKWPLAIEVLSPHQYAQTRKAGYENWLVLKIASDGSKYHWQYNPDKISECSVLKIDTHVRTILENFSVPSAHKVGALPILTENERHILLNKWNHPLRSIEEDACIHEFIELHAENCPSSTAVIFGESKLSYQDLNERSNQLAHYLLNNGVGPGAFVGICMERSLDVIISIVATLKSGAAYAPIDPYYPDNYKKHVIENSGIGLILSSKDNKFLIEDFQNCTWLKLGDDNIQTELNSLSTQNIPKDRTGLTARDPAYVIYTSGSTGAPKGVIVPHSGICNLSRFSGQFFSVTRKSRMLQFASISFDAAIWEITTALCHGATLVMISQEIIQSAEKLSIAVQKMKITHAILPPVLLSVLDLDYWSHVNTLIVGGEACSRTQAERWSANRNFYNAYGPTETTVCASIGRYTPGQACLHIGNPIDNVQLYVLDKYQQLLPIGVQGELYIGGAGVALGYHNQHELNKTRFISNPFSPGQHIYRTGDIVRWLEDGNLEFIERSDYQVKIRGFRIELGEIEHCALLHSDINEAAVIVRQDQYENRYLACYLVAKNTLDNERKILDSVLRHFQSHLPKHMIPASLQLIPKLPISPNGKVDRKHLLQIDTALKQEDYHEPRTPAEKAVCAVWKNVLQLEKAGITDHFFQRGGNSILVFYATSLLLEAGWDVSPKQIYDHSKPIDLAKLIKPKVKDNDQPSLNVITGSAPVLPNNLLYFSDGYPNHWNTSFILRTTIPYTQEVLHKALTDLLLQHDALRTLWRKDQNGIWYQYFQAPPEMLTWWSVIDLTSLSEPEAIKAIERHSASEQLTLDASKILFKALYFKLGKKYNSRLLIIAHHILMDNYSIDIFLEDLGKLADSYQKGVPFTLPNKSTSIKELAEIYADYTQQPDLDNDFEYWMSRPWHLFYTLPVDTNTHLLTREHSSRIVHDSLTIAETTGLELALQQQNLSLQDVLLTALVHAYGEWVGHKTLALFLTNHGRLPKLHKPVDLSRTIGLLPIQSMHFLSLPDDAQAYEAPHIIKFQLQETSGREANHILLKTKHSNAKVRQKMSELPQPQLSFNIFPRLPESTNDNNYGLQWGDENLGALYSPMEHSFFPYGLSEFRDGALRIQWTYCSSMYNESTMRDFLHMNMSAIRTMIIYFDKRRDVLRAEKIC